MCMRRGDYSGGILTFPEFRVGANLQDGDLFVNGRSRMAWKYPNDITFRRC